MRKWEVYYSRIGRATDTSPLPREWVGIINALKSCDGRVVRGEESLAKAAVEWVVERRMECSGDDGEYNYG